MLIEVFINNIPKEKLAEYRACAAEDRGPVLLMDPHQDCYLKLVPPTRYLNNAGMPHRDWEEKVEGATGCAGSRWRKVGPKMWAAIFAWALALDGSIEAGAGYAGWEAVRYLRWFRSRIWCADCQRHWDEMYKRTPPPLWGRTGTMTGWVMARHSEVSARIGKPVWALVPGTTLSQKGPAPHAG